MLANTFALHPADAALGAAARLQHRGDDPMVMVDAGNTFHANNAAWLNATPYYGPGGETGVAEAEVEKALLRILKPGAYFGERALLADEPRTATAEEPCQCSLSEG